MTETEIKKFLAEQEARLKQQFQNEIGHLETDITRLQNSLAELEYQIQTIQTEILSNN